VDTARHCCYPIKGGQSGKIGLHGRRSFEDHIREGEEVGRPIQQVVADLLAGNRMPHIGQRRLVHLSVGGRIGSK
jgi:hypothetical protein